MQNRHYIFQNIIVSFCTAFVVVGLGFVFLVTHKENVVKNPVSTAVYADATNASVVNAVEKANPAVVSIIITKNVPIIERYYSDSPINFFGRQFNIQVPQYKQNGTMEQEVGGGSGFFVTADGLIVTNKHVVDDIDAEYTVYTNDGQKHKAKVVSKDPNEDIAFIRVDAPVGTKYPFLTMGSSKNLKLGQSVIAIGNALSEFRNTVSVGVVSGLARSITAGNGMGDSEQLNEVIQTDAAINPGNSGGPLIDLEGKVVGINVAVAEGSQNIGFALPADRIHW